MQLSKLEDEKRKGKLDLNFLKRNRKEQSPEPQRKKADPSYVMPAPIDFRSKGGVLKPIGFGTGGENLLTRNTTK